MYWINSQGGVVGSSHGEESLECMCGIGVLNDALRLQVGHQERHRLQQLLFRELDDQTEATPSHTVKYTCVMESTQCNGKESAYLTSEGHNILDGIRFQNWELVH